MSRNNRLPALSLAALAILSCLAFVRLARMVPEPAQKPIADAIKTNDERHIGVVVEVDPQHSFENGTTTEGWLVRAADGTEVVCQNESAPHGIVLENQTVEMK